jgi:hypothetical protein
MKLKLFFTPSYRKFILFILLFLFLPFPIYVAEPVCPKVIGYDCKPYWTAIPFILTGLIGTTTVTERSIFFNFVFFKEYWFYVLTDIVWSYLLACLITRFYEKLVKKRIRKIL